MQDSVERDVMVRAPIERVWQVLTDPAYVARWFGRHAEFELREGAPARFEWDDFGWFAARIERVEPPTRFSFRWADKAHRALDAGSSTLVEFTLTASNDGTTRLHVVESGFASLPADRRDRALEDHVDGWRTEFDDLVALVDQLQASGAS